VEEDVSKESSHGKRDQVVDHGVAERRFGQEEQVEQVYHEDRHYRDKESTEQRLGCVRQGLN
jgi:hypothetical protein